MSRDIKTENPQYVERELSVREQLDLKEGELREKIAKKITNAFIVVNLGVIALVLLGIGLDHYFIAHQLIKGGERLVTTPLIMTIIGATTVQLGAISVTMSNWLFPKNRPPAT